MQLSNPAREIWKPAGICREKKGKKSAGKVCACKKSDGGGVVLKMTMDSVMLIIS
jgi:hypothetical protein